MAFISGAIDEENMGRFKALVEKVGIAAFTQEPNWCDEVDGYVVLLSVDADPETLLLALQEHLGDDGGSEPVEKRVAAGEATHGIWAGLPDEEEE